MRIEQIVSIGRTYLGSATSLLNTKVARVFIGAIALLSVLVVIWRWKSRVVTPVNKKPDPPPSVKDPQRELEAQPKAREGCTDAVERANIRLGIARQYFAQGKYDLAISEYTAASQMYKQYRPADEAMRACILSDRGTAHFNKGEYLQALDDYKAALKFKITPESKKIIENNIRACQHDRNLHRK